MKIHRESSKSVFHNNVEQFCTVLVICLPEIITFSER